MGYEEIAMSHPEYDETPPSGRSAIVTLILVVGLTVYGLTVMLVGIYYVHPTYETIRLVAAVIYYAFFGYVWVYPTKRLIKWGAGRRA